MDKRWWKFEGLKFNLQDTIGMSRDLAVAIQQVRDHLGNGNVRHVGVYRDRPNQRSQRTGSWLSGPPWTGHYWGDAIDLKAWGSHSYDETLEGCRKVPGLRVVDERGIMVIHIEVNHGSHGLSVEDAAYWNSRPDVVER